MRLARAQIENFQKITVVDIAIGEGVTEISGKNAAGKSSTFAALHGLFVQLAMPADPIRHGAETCAIRTHLKGDDGSVLLVTKRLREDKAGKVVTDLVLETPDGARFPQPATHLKQLIGDHMLDPLKFLEMDADKQLEVLKSFVPGFDFEANKRLYDGLFAKRTEVNKDQKREQAAADSIIVPAGTPETESNVVDLSAELEAAIAHNNDCATRKTNRENAQARIVELRDSADLDIRTIQADALHIAVKADETVADLEAQIESLKQKIKRTHEETKQSLARNQGHYEGEAARKRAEADSLEQKIAAAGELKTPHTEEEIAVKRQAIATAQSTNRHVDAAKTKREHERKAAGFATDSVKLSTQLDALEEQREDAIQKAALPVQGLGFGNGFVTLNGAPFKQASKGERMRTAFALVVAKQPELRLCWISDAALLDDDNRALIEQMAAEFRCQVLLETIKPGSSNAIILEDGHVAGVEPVFSLTAAPSPLSEGPAANEPEAKPTKGKRKWQGPGAPNGDVA